MHRISNGTVALALDDRARLAELRNLQTGRDYAGGRGLWRLIYSHGPVIEEEITAGACEPRISSPAPETLRIEYADMPAPTGREAFALTIDIRLAGEDILFSAELANHAGPDRVIREFNFPTIQNLALAPGQCLYGFGPMGGRPQRIEDIPAAIARRHSLYIAEDQKGINLPWSMNGFAMFADESDSLYLGDHDPAFGLTTHLFRKRGGEIDAGFHRSPYLAPGGKTTLSGFVVSPLAGDWHACARKFRRWFDRWYEPAPKPASLTRGFNGWYRLIFRHQYGKVLFAYDDMPRILASMKQTGIDTLIMFGWWRDGMDAGYPEYAFDESQGGREALKARIREFREAGGKVILYFNGRLIDTATEYYRTRGKNIAIQGPDRCNIIEAYKFAGPGINLRHLFGHKSFALACPYSREWLDILKRHIDTAIDLGADGVFFDQLGMPERPCFNPDHGHPAPMMDGRAKRMEQLRELRKHLKSRRPEMSFGAEWVHHMIAPFVDYCHSCPGWNDVVNRNWEKAGQKPKLTHFVELFRYTFPEIPVSDRGIREDTDIERRVNLALLRGLFSDVEVHRCRSLIEETPHYKAYLTKANALRDRFRRLIVNGLFRDTEGATCDNPEVAYAVFTAGDELALVATQSHLPETTAAFRVPGYRFRDWGALGEVALDGAAAGETFRLTISKHGLAVLVFRKEPS